MAGDRTRYVDALKKGSGFLKNEQWREAIAAYRIAISEFPDRAEAYAGLGEACLGQKQYDRALECFKLAARHSQGNVQFLGKVADIQERMGMLGEAGRTYMATGEIYLRQRDAESAISNWERAVRLEPNLLGAHQRLAMVFQRTGETKKGRARISGHRPQFVHDGRIEEGDANVPRRVAPRPRQPRCVDCYSLGAPRRRGVPRRHDGLADAIRQMAAVLESEKSSWQLGGNQDAVSSARTFAQEKLAEEIFREEDNEDLLYGTGDGLSKLERDALIGQAMDFESRGDAAKAIACYEKVLKGGLDLPAAYFTLGVLYLDTGRKHDALTMFDKARGDGRFVAAIGQLLS
ncbi:MAG: tetratricopeptide repeat protein [Chloroflexi bacterium]|nr:tetratricopeptide repeat protein [Chloroflexota bacterium]